MARKYVTCRPVRASWDPDDWECPEVVRTVYEPDPEPRPTGLFDHHGNELFACDEREPIGFRLKGK